MGFGYGGGLGGTGATGVLFGLSYGLAAGPGGGFGFGGALGGTHVGQVGGFTVARGGEFGYGGTLGDAGAVAAPSGQAGGFAGGAMGGLGYDGALGGTGTTGAPSVAFAHTVRDGRVVPEVGSASHGNGGAGDTLMALGRQVNRIMTNRAVTSWGNSTTRQWQIICGGRPLSL